MPPAARLTDGVEHSLGLLGMLAGALIGAALVAGTCATGGLLGAALIAGTVAGGALAGGKIMNALTSIFNLPGIPTGTILFVGSPDVMIGHLLAARAQVDGAACNGVMTLYHWPMPSALIAQGSATVLINGLPAARIGDKLICGGIIELGENTVIIGGPTATVLPIHDPEEELKEFLTVVAVVSAVILTGGAVGAVLAGTLSAGAFLGGLGIAGAFGVTSWAAQKFLPPGYGDLVSGIVDLAGIATMSKLAESIAEPIYPPTGEVCTMATDFVLPGVLELCFERYYASSHGQSDWLGPNWSCSWGQRIISIGAGVVQYFPGDGRKIIFELNSPADSLGWLRNPHVDNIKLQATSRGYRVKDKAGRIQSFDLALGNAWPITSTQDRNGNYISFHYGPDGALRVVEHSGYRLLVSGTPRTITSIDLEDGAKRHRLVGFSYDAAGCLSGVDNGSGKILTYEYDTSARLTRWRDRKETWTTYIYDEQGRCVESTGPNGLYAYKFSYHPEAHLTVATDPYGGTIIVHYDERNRVVAKCDQNGNTTKMEWDERGNRVRVIDAEKREAKYKYDLDGNLVSSIDPSGREVKFEYNGLDLPVVSTDAAGKRWLRQYDERGNLIGAGLEGAAIWHYTYDQFGNVVVATDPDNQRRQYSYNAAGLTLAVSDCEGNTTRFRRDAFGRVAFRTDALGNETRYFYNELRKLSSAQYANGGSIQWNWDTEGNLVERIGPDGGAYRYEYGSYDKLLSIQRPGGTTVRFEYDQEARLINVVNDREERWQYEYDKAGHLISEKDFSGRMQLYRNDATGSLIERTNGNGDTVVLSRAKGGEVLKKTSIDGVTEFTYDDNGLLASAKNELIAVVFERDAYGRVVRESQGSNTVESWFDARGLRSKRRVNGQETVWRYDANGRTKGVGLANDEWLEFTRDAIGRDIERRITRGDDMANMSGFLLQQEYDPMSNLTRQWSGSKNAPINERRLQYDDSGNLRASDERLCGASWFSYDADGRLEAVERNVGVSEGFRYDITGEIAAAVKHDTRQGITREGIVAGFQMRFIGRGGRLEKVGETQFEYDADGRTVVKRKSDKVWRYEWTVEGQLRAVVLPTGARWAYEYDAFGRRVQKSGPGGVTTYVWDGGVIAEEIREKSGSGIQKSAWHFEPGTFRPLAKVENGNTYACVLDQVGTPRELVTSDGKLAWSGHYTAFGEVETIRENETDCSIRFQGQWFDEESGLHYNWNRYYDPEISRYLSADPIGLQGGTSPYSYVHNPLAWIDPLGLAGCGTDTNSGSQAEAFSQAKIANDIPTSQQPDVTYKPGTPEGDAVGLDPARNGRMYEYTNSQGQKVWIRQDYPATYGEPSGVGDQGPHYNAGPAGSQKLPQHHYWSDD